MGTGKLLIQCSTTFRVSGTACFPKDANSQKRYEHGSPDCYGSSHASTKTSCEDCYDSANMTIRHRVHTHRPTTTFLGFLTANTLQQTYTVQVLRPNGNCTHGIHTLHHVDYADGGRCHIGQQAMGTLLPREGTRRSRYIQKTVLRHLFHSPTPRPEIRWWLLGISGMQR